MSDFERIKLIETFYDYPIDKKYSCTVFIGKSMYIDEDRVDTVDIPEADIDEFFKAQGYIEGYSRVSAKGRYGQTIENSEMVMMFDKTLRSVLKFCYDYNKQFSQESVYLQINSVNEFEVKGEGSNVSSNS